MEKHRCKLCSKTFANGRALGGHMKGHLSSLPPPKPSKFSSSWSSSSSSEEDEDNKIQLSYALRENPMKTAKLKDPEFSATVVVQDRESETESRNPTRKRSKRTRKSAFVHKQQPVLKKKSLIMAESQSPPVSSISDGSADEDVAMCLIMLSRDKWTSLQQVEEDIGQHAKKFECDKCKKMFQSSKALAGHKAIHKRNRDLDDDGKDKIFECPFCFKVFGSGQALGGHKRSHLMGHHANNGNGSLPAADASCSSAIAISSTFEVKMNAVLIDLNLPAPVEEEEEDDDDGYSAVSEVKILS